MAGIELELIEWLRRQGGGKAHRSFKPARMPTRGATGSSTIPLGIGDDMAIIDLSFGRLLVSSDMLLDGVHFDTKRHGLSLIGRKAIACGLSDCAAMAVEPRAATVSVALPSGMSLVSAQTLLAGMRAIADEFNLALVGGDTTSWENSLAIDVAILATPYPGIEPVRRSGATTGDILFVTGQLGGSLLGRHLTFTPQVALARNIAEALGDRLHAMMDLSDGLALDLWRMCQASGTGATLEESRLEAVISPDARRAASADRRSPLDHALSDGEDFELLLAVDPEASLHGLLPPLQAVGTVIASGLCIVRPDGRTCPLEPKGYAH